MDPEARIGSRGQGSRPVSDSRVPKLFSVAKQAGLCFTLSLT